MSGMAEVLAAHWSRSTHSDSEPYVDKCDGCGVVIYTWGNEPTPGGIEPLAAHQAAMLDAAGYGGPCEAARSNTKALYLLENEWGCGRIDVGQLQKVLRGDEPDTCPGPPEPADAKFLRGERKSLLKLLDGWEGEGHSTVTIRFLRQHLTKKESRR